METLFDKTFLINKWNSYDKFFNAKIIYQNISNLFMCINIFVNCDLNYTIEYNKEYNIYMNIDKL